MDVQGYVACQKNRVVAHLPQDVAERKARGEDHWRPSILAGRFMLSLSNSIA